MTLHDLARLLRSSLILILISTAFGLLAAGISVAATPKSYESKALVYVDIELPTDADADALEAASTLASVQTITIKALATSDLVLDRVIDELGLDTTPRQLAGNVTALAALDTAVIEIIVDRGDAEEARDIANAVGAALVSEFTTSGSGDAPLLQLRQAGEAVAASSPVTPNVALNVALGLFGGLALGCGIAILRHGFSPRILHASELDAPGGPRVVEVRNIARTNDLASLGRILGGVGTVRVIGTGRESAIATVTSLAPATAADAAVAVVVVRRGSSRSRLDALARALENEGGRIGLHVLYNRSTLR